MFGAVPVPTDRADLGVFVMDTDGIWRCVATASRIVTALIVGAVMQAPTRERTPAGLVDVTVMIADGVVTSSCVRKRRQSSETVTVEQDGVPVEARIVYSGNSSPWSTLTASGSCSTARTPRSVSTPHGTPPSRQRRRTQGPSTGRGQPSRGRITASDDSDRSCVVFADGSVDRSPCGTGTCARLTLHHVDGDLAVGERVEVTGPVGPTFEGYITDTSVDSGAPCRETIRATRRDGRSGENDDDIRFSDNLFMLRQ